MKKQAGFSLIELMTIIAIIAILSAIAIPNAISWRNNAQVNSAARGLYADLQSARSTAIKENMNCTIVIQDNERYIIFLERTANATLQVNNNERILKTVNFSDYGSVSFGSSSFPVNDDNDPAITFRPSGFPFGRNGELAGGNVVLRGASDKRVVLEPAGNIRIEEI